MDIQNSELEFKVLMLTRQLPHVRDDKGNIRDVFPEVIVAVIKIPPVFYTERRLEWNNGKEFLLNEASNRIDRICHDYPEFKKAEWKKTFINIEQMVR